MQIKNIFIYLLAHRPYIMKATDKIAVVCGSSVLIPNITTLVERDSLLQHTEEGSIQDLSAWLGDVWGSIQLFGWSSGDKYFMLIGCSP